LTDGLSAFYPFNGSAADASGNGNDGSISEMGITPSADRFAAPSSAYRFTNATLTTNQINCGDPVNNAFDLTGDATLTAWINLAVTPPAANNANVAPVLSKNAGSGASNKYTFGVNANRVTFHVNTTSSGLFWAYSDPHVFQTNQWYQIAVTKTGNTYHFFINGTNFGSQTVTLAVPDVAAPLTIGFAEVAPLSQVVYNGDIDDVRIYNRALATNEVAQLYLFESEIPEAAPTKAVRPLFSKLAIGGSYQLQVTTMPGSWTNHGSSFIATNNMQSYPEAFDVDEWGRLFFRLQSLP